MVIELCALCHIDTRTLFVSVVYRRKRPRHLTCHGVEEGTVFQKESIVSKESGGPEILADKSELLRSINGVVVPDYREQSQQIVSEKDTGFDCINIVKMVGDFVDGELTPRLHNQCQAHINQCAYCGRLLDEYRATIALAAELRDVPPPPEVSDRLRNVLRAKLKAFR